MTLDVTNLLYIVGCGESVDGDRLASPQGGDL